MNEYQMLVHKSLSDIPVSSSHGLNFEHTFASSAYLKEVVFRMRHDCYSRVGSIDPQTSGLFSDPYDLHPQVMSYVINCASLPIASVRACLSIPECSCLPVPAAKIFAAEIAAATGWGGGGFWKPTDS